MVSNYQQAAGMQMSRSRFLGLVGMGMVGTSLLGISAPAQAGAPYGVALGVWNSGVPWDLSKLNEYTRQVGTIPQVVLWYQSWGPTADAAFGLSLSEALYQAGHAQVLTWEPKDWRYGKDQPRYSLRAIASGSHDDYIRQYARRIRDWGRLLYVRLMHEMNGNWYPWGANVNVNKPAHFRTAWMHVVDIFRQERVSNVRWVWCPNVGRPVWNAPYPMSNFYPGDDYVDWVGLDGYNYAGSRNMPWYSFRQVFERSYREVSALAPTKPLMLVESGCDESGGNKAAWILSIKDDLKDRFPKVSAFVWFNQDEGPSKLTVDSSADALKAFGSLVADTHMQGALPR